MLRGTDSSPARAPGLDLTTYSDATRRAIYHSVVEDYFTRRLFEGDWFDPPYTADQAVEPDPKSPAGLYLQEI